VINVGHDAKSASCSLVRNCCRRRVVFALRFSINGGTIPDGVINLPVFVSQFFLLQFNDVLLIGRFMSEMKTG